MIGYLVGGGGIHAIILTTHFAVLIDSELQASEGEACSGLHGEIHQLVKLSTRTPTWRANCRRISDE
jgi:hypothetical protein